jgi:phosphohistidine phosphatase SixA
VCLSSFGNVQAKAMGEWIKSIGVPIGEVISSVSCRARQTASLAFKAPDILYPRLLNYYGTPYPVFDEPVDMHFAEIKQILLKHAPRDKTNTVISAHNNTISIEMLDGVLESRHRRQADIDVLLEEGGFHVLKVVGKKLLWVTKFHTFQGFANKFTKRPTEAFPFANPSSEAKKSS